METVSKYGRLSLAFDDPAVDAVEYTLPDGTRETGPAFWDLPVEFRYDEHGYETVLPVGARCKAARYTPVQPGKYSWRALAAGVAVAAGAFLCVESAKHGYVQVSRKDGRYFAYTDGTPYVPIGLNLCAVDYHQLPKSMEHFGASSQAMTPGCISYERYFRELRENGGNYCRLWLSSTYLEARTETPGVQNYLALARFERVAELARKYGIRLKLCFDHFRTFTNTESFFHRKMRDPMTGERMTDIEQWYNDRRWNELWLKDVSTYLDRLWNDPVVFAWELWNENDCGDACFETVLNWTGRMIPEIRKRSPRNLVTNSLGSFDESCKQAVQDAFRDLAVNDFQQVHRYLDQGAPLEICRTDPVAFSIDAVHLSRRPDKPIILTETGAVNDRHTGGFRFYHADHNGLIFLDVTYPAFFAGAAGTGHIWHWDVYALSNNLFPQFKPFANMLQGVNVDEEGFVEEDDSTDGAWVLRLAGRKHALLFVRSRADRWDHVLRDGIKPAPVTGLAIDIPSAKAAQAYWLCGEAPGEVKLEGEKLLLPNFTHGCVIRAELQS